MTMGWKSLAIGAEISVVAHSALISIPCDVRRLRNAKRAITVYTPMTLRRCRGRKGLINRYKAMLGVTLFCTLDAIPTIVPVRAVHTLVTHTVDVLFAYQCQYLK